MSKNAIAFLTGLGSGYMTAAKDKEKQKRDEEDRALRNEAAQLQIDAAKRTVADQQTMRDAGAERTAIAGTAVDTGYGKNLYTDPAQATAAAEDSRIENEMRGELAGTAAKPVQTMVANGIIGNMATGNKITTDPVDLKALNSPEARTQRTTAVLHGMGRTMDAIKLENATLDQRAALRKEADDVWRQKVGTAMQGGHEGLAQLATQTEVGPLAGKKVKSVLSVDGKMINYNIINDDGTLKPTEFSFSNDQNGIIQAGYLMDRAVTPEHRYTNYVAEKKAAAQLSKDNAVFDEAKRHNRATETNTASGQRITDERARDLNATKVEENKLKREAKEDTANLTKASQLASFDTMLGTLDRLGKHPGLTRSVGLTGALPTMPGSDSANFQAELNTFQSQAFLPMVAQLKGMGALSDAEGKKLTAAVGALDPKMGEKAFRESVGRITADMDAARKRMEGIGQRAATGSAGSGAAAPLPMPKSMADMKKDSVYQTGRGLAKWNGTAFEAQ